MNDIVDTRKGDIVIGATLVLTGVAIVLDRAGLAPWGDRWTLWPVIFGGLGLARFLQSPPGQPKQGLLLLTAAAWLLAAQAGWVSLADSWPFAIIALGIIVAFNGGRRRRWTPQAPPVPGDPGHLKRPYRHARTLSGLGVIGVWIAVFVALQAPGTRSFSSASVTGENRVRVVSVMSRSEHIGRATAFEGAEVINVMGRSELDLQDAILEPGTEANVHVVSAMGSVVLRVPSNWTVDPGAVSAFGGVRDDRLPPAEADTTAGPAPRLVLRGLIAFGRLTITS